jgi:glycerol-3-phosphate dehydrogenase
MAEKAIDIVMRRIGRTYVPSKTGDTPIYGGEIDSFPVFLAGALSKRLAEVTEGQTTALVHNYGTQYVKVLNYLKENPDLGKALGSSTVLKAEIIHAVREEAAQKLSDVVFRRTDLGTAELPSQPVLHDCAQLMADELGWDGSRLHREIDAIQAPFRISDH